MIKKIVFLALAMLTAGLLSYPTITSAHRIIGPISLFDQHQDTPVRSPSPPQYP
ncbi:hypothetical protein LV478_16860 [Komagataeibacter oboediens]|uniref:hypothetical protein n=1 Tax=Komagataeibacter oboediens TaxID=65958 RepID=UPI0019086677|nr:hypothetical protein [Komagataeibacter oboediens]WEQ52131.1 hypothetical protein LV478_16860 [Komagataeibacter oboediens]GCE79521.1 hypothetical protein MSKU3_0996 [Komagataeibacter oboediens]